MIRLSNGLRVVIEKIDYVRSVSVGLWIENGSRNETVENNGISHFIEHMLFKGTNNRTAKELAEVIEDVGGQINAFTGKEATCFYIKLLDSHLELALEVLSDMLFNSKFSEEEIEREKGVIICPRQSRLPIPLSAIRLEPYNSAGSIRPSYYRLLSSGPRSTDSLPHWLRRRSCISCSHQNSLRM